MRELTRHPRHHGPLTAPTVTLKAYVTADSSPPHWLTVGLAAATPALRGARTTDAVTVTTDRKES